MPLQCYLTLSKNILVFQDENLVATQHIQWKGL